MILPGYLLLLDLHILILSMKVSDANFAAPSPCWIPPLPPSNFGPPAAGAFPPFMPPVPPWMGATPMPPGPFPPAPPYGEAKIGIDDEEGGEASFFVPFLTHVINAFYVTLTYLYFPTVAS